MQKRDWKSWPTRFREEVNSTSGLFALAGAGVAGVGILATTPIVTAGGAVLTAGLSAYSAFRSIPPARPVAKKAIGTRVTNLHDLAGMHPPVCRIGFVGISESGKTTLLSNLNASPAPTSQRTDAPYADITCLVGAPDRVVALIDGAGQQFGQQFKVVDESDHLIVVLDHNASSTEAHADPDRVARQEDFLYQLASYVGTSGKSLKNVCILMNKSDLWVHGPDSRAVRDWLDSCHRAWNMVPGISLTARHHSNFRVQDTNSLVGLVKGWS